MSNVPLQKSLRDHADGAPDCNFEPSLRKQYIERRTYTYQALQTSTTIRILELFPGMREDDLRGRLRQVDLNGAGYPAFNPINMRRFREIKDRVVAPSPVYNRKRECPPYEALSYVWGSSHKTCPLYTGMGIIWINYNLGVALRRLRLRNRVRALWADGVCINQQDTLERGHQVRLMSSVYQKAFRVLVWLGLDPFHQAKKVFQTFEKNALKQVTDTTILMTLNMTSKCAWFERVWVVQEVYFAQAAVAMWGNEQIDFHAISDTMLAVRQMIPITTSWVVQLFQDDFEALDFLQVLSSMRNLRCSDDRDRIYALLSLPYRDLEVVSLIEPDYTITTNDLYISIASDFVKHGKVFDLLSLTHHGSKLDVLPKGLPSWVPNWANSFAPNLTLASKAKKHQELIAWVNNDSHYLYVKGFCFDVVSAASKALHGARDEALNSPIVASFWALCAEDASRHPLFIDQELWKELKCGSNEYYDPNRCDKRLLHRIQLFSGHDNFIVGSNLRAGKLRSRRSRRSSVSVISSLSSVKGRGDLREQILPSFPESIEGLKLFNTSHGFIGLGPSAIEHGDVVVILKGSEIPFVLRPSPHFQPCQFVGTAYVSRIMRGDCSELLQELTDKSQVFEIR